MLYDGDLIKKKNKFPVLLATMSTLANEMS